MKCISCGNIIPDTSNVCPYCNNKVEPIASAIPVYDTPVEQTVAIEPNMNAMNVNNSPMQAAPSVPVTPVAPVLPQDQNLVVEPVAPVMEPMQTPPVEPVTPVAPQMESVAQAVEPVVEAAPQIQTQTMEVNNMMQSTPTSTVVEIAPVQNIQNPVVNEVPTAQVLENTTTVPPITPTDNAMLDGTKIASGNPQPETKKKKSKLIIILIVVILLLALIGGGVFFYTSQFKSVDKRIDEIVNGLFKFTTGIKNDTVELASGSYDIKASLNANETEMTAKVNGKYAYDLEKKLIDVTLNAEEINLGEELKLIPDKQPLSIELYTYDSKGYLLLQNFYENYISADIEGYDEIFSGIEQNDIDYQLLINSFKVAIKSGLKSANYTQTIGDVTVSGKTEKANIIKLALTEANQRAITTAAYNALINNAQAMEQLAKLDDTTVDELKEEMKKGFESVEYDKDNSTVVEIYTAMFGNKFIGAKLTGKSEDNKPSLIEINPVQNGVKVICKEDNKEFLNMEVNLTTKNTSTTKETNSKINLVFYDDKEKANKVMVDVTVVEDINPKVEKVNIKNSVDYRYISAEDQQKIITNISNYGTIGLYFQSFFASSLTPSTPESSVVDPNASTTISNSTQTIY